MNNGPIWIPLKNRTFRNLWVAGLLSGSAVSAYNMAATWLLNTMTPSPLILSLMSTFATLPFFLFTLPAGVLADLRHFSGSNISTSAPLVSRRVQRGDRRFSRQV